VSHGAIDQPTCGQGLAKNSAIPTKLAQITGSMAAVLETHMQALDSNDEDSQREHAAYLNLAQEHRAVTVQLRALAEEMAGYRDLPMGKHDQNAMSSRQVIDAFERFVAAERELLALLRARVEQDQRMLSEVRAASS
jgi:hypothetical protein